MGERKVLNKYIPPDFDPSLVPRRKRPKNEQITVRMMLPFSVQCSTCGEYMYRGKKFNSKKEDVDDQDYLGIRIFRFYIKCVTCSAEITFTTDPKNGDYKAEHGCVRNFEPWREQGQLEEQAMQQKEEEEKGDAMKALENRTLDSKREMDILDALDEIKAINQRHARIDTDALLQLHQRQDKDQDPATELLADPDLVDAELAHQVFANRNRSKAVASSTESDTLETIASARTSASAKEEETKTAVMPTIVVRKKTVVKKKGVKRKIKVAAETQPVVTSLVADYSDSSSDE